MQFLFPGLIWALAAIAIPVIIHLFYFRRFKKVPFSNIRFLKEIKEETSTRSKLRNLLILLARMLAIAFLVLAFAQPYIPYAANVGVGPQDVSIFVDNSFSMSALDRDVPLFEKAKQKAKEIVRAYGDESRFQILTHDFEGRHQRLVSKEEAIGLIDEIRQTPIVHTLSKVIKRQKDALSANGSKEHRAYLFSDFQRSITDVEALKMTDTSMEVFLLPLRAIQEVNVGIDSCWLLAPVPVLHQPNSLLVKIHNYGTKAVDEIPLAISLNDHIRPQGTVSVPPGSTVTDTLNFVLDRPGWHRIVVSIGDYPVQFDDKYYAAFYVRDKLNVLVIGDGQQNKYLNAGLKGISYFRYSYQNAGSLDYSSLPRYQLIVLNELKNLSSGLASTLKEVVAAGGNVLIIPSATQNLKSLNDFLSAAGLAPLSAFAKEEKQVFRINRNEFIFKDVFTRIPKNMKLPHTTGAFSRKGITGIGEEVLLSYRDGTPYLIKKNLGAGNIYLLTSPLDLQYNDLVKNSEIFIPMLFKMAISGTGAPKIAYVIGQDETIEIKNPGIAPDEVLKFYFGEEAFLPEQRIVGDKVILNVHGQTKKAGFYRLSKTATDTLGLFGFNYDHRESDMNFFTGKELASLLPNFHVLAPEEITGLSATIKQQSKGKALWRKALIAALLFLLVEVLLVRLWKP